MGNKLSSQQLRRQVRIDDFEITMATCTDKPQGYKRPGSINRHKSASVKRLRGKR